MDNLKLGDSISGQETPYKEEFAKAQANFENELSFIFNNEKGIIKVYEARFIAEGSCDIIFNNGKVIDIYIQDEKLNYLKEGISQEMQDYIEGKIKRVYELKVVKDKIMDKILGR